MFSQHSFIGSDEKTYDSIYQTNKDIVHLVKCGWFQFFDVMSVLPECEQAAVPAQDAPVDTCPQEVCEEVPQEQACEQPVETVTCTESQEAVLETSCETPIEEVQQCCSDFCATQTMAMQANSSALEVKKSWWRRMVGI